MVTASASLAGIESGDSLVEVRGLKKWFPLHGGVFSRVVAFVKAVDGVHFDIRRGETFGLVGESGCGKTTTGRLILRLLEPTGGEVFFEGEDLFKLDMNRMRRARRCMQMIFQDPYASLNPRMTVGSILREPLQVHGVARGAALDNRVRELLEVVGLSPEYAKRYPHEFSGGQRQRIGIARALALRPKLIICDEPVSALDVSIRSQIINLLEDLQREFGLSYLFIAHDLSVVKHICDRAAVMYLGKIVEVAPKNDLYLQPLHPYTQALLSAVPVPDPEVQVERIILEGDVPNPVDPPPGCRFHTRCWVAEDVCRREEPALTDTGGGHYVACHRCGESAWPRGATKAEA